MSCLVKAGVLIVWLAAVGSASPTDAPDLPAHRPRPTSPATANPPAGAGTFTLQLVPGWNAVSFPFTQIQGARGFAYELLRPTPQGEHVVDAGLHPDQVDCRAAYWAYTDRPSTVVVWGTGLPGRPANLSLAPGWNFIGCPSAAPLELGRMTVGVGTSSGRTLEEAVLSSPPWLYGSAFQVRGGKFDAIGTRRPNHVLTPGSGHWVYAYRNLLLTLNQSPGPVSRVTGIARDGDGWAITGTNFGSQGRLILDGSEVKGPYIRSWAPTRIVFAVPPGMHSQLLTVVVNGVPGERLTQEQARAMLAGASTGPAAQVGGLELYVLNAQNVPIYGARVRVEGAEEASTDTEGRVVFSGLAPGQHSLAITARNFNPIRNSVSIPAGRTYRLMATMSSPSAALYVKALPYTYGPEFRPYRIDMYQKNNYSRRYYNTWYYSQATPYVDLTWNDCTAGETYVIDVYWRDPSSQEQKIREEKSLPAGGCNKTFYNSWNY